MTSRLPVLPPVWVLLCVLVKSFISEFSSGVLLFLGSVFSVWQCIQNWFLISLGFPRFLNTFFSDFRWLHWFVLLHRHFKLFFNLLLCIDFLIWCFTCNKNVILVSERILLKYLLIIFNTTLWPIAYFPRVFEIIFMYFYMQILWVF